MKTISKSFISQAAALRLAQDALAHAETQDWHVAVAICDPNGRLVAFLRADDVLIPAIDFAIDKAMTAATMRMSTSDWFDTVKDSPSMSLGMANRDRLMDWTGGLPILQDDVCIGGIGVSGVQDVQDRECAEAALRASGFE